MKKIALLMAFFCLSTQAFWAKKCNNDNLRNGEVIGWNLERCINNNFWQIEIKFPRLFLDRCQAFPRSRVSSSFQRCINDNFRKIERAEPRVFAHPCNNFGRDQVGERYLKCINRNFQDIERDLRFL